MAERRELRGELRVHGGVEAEELGVRRARGRKGSAREAGLRGVEDGWRGAVFVEEVGDRLRGRGRGGWMRGSPMGLRLGLWLPGRRPGREWSLVVGGCGWRSVLGRPRIRAGLGRQGRRGPCGEGACAGIGGGVRRGRLLWRRLRVILWRLARELWGRGAVLRRRLSYLGLVRLGILKGGRMGCLGCILRRL